MGGVRGGHGEGLSVGLKEVLANRLATQEGKQGLAQAVLSRGGELLTQTEDIVGRWKEHFEELLNPANTPFGEEAESEASGEVPPMSLADVAEVVKQLFSGKAPGVDEIRPEMLKALDIVGLSWLTRLFNVVWGSGTVPVAWQTGVVVPIFKKGDRRVCSNYRGITLLSLPGKHLFQKVLERRLQPIVETQLQEEQCGFRPGRGTVAQLFTLAGLLGGAWEFAHPASMCFVDLEKADDCVPRGILWGLLREYGVPWPLVRAIWSLNKQSESCVRILGTKSSTFSVGVGVRQGCPLSPILFVIFMDRISRRSRGEESVRFGDLRLASLLFADDVVLLATSDHDLQHALGRFAAECEVVGMRVSTSKSEAMVLCRKTL